MGTLLVRVRESVLPSQPVHYDRGEDLWLLARSDERAHQLS